MVVRRVFQAVRMATRGAAPIAFTVLVLFGGPSLAASVPSRSLPTYVLLGLDTVNMKAFAFTNMGNVGTNDAGGTMSWGNKSFFDNGSEVVSDVLLRAGDKSSLFDLFANKTPSSLANVTIRDAGPTSFSPLPLIGSLPTLPSCSPGGSAIVVPKNGTRNLTAGTYASIRVQDGGTLHLAGGTYCIASFKTGRKVTVSVDGPIMLEVSGTLTIGDGSALRPGVGSGIGASDIIVDVAGKSVKYGRKTKIFGDFFAPNALLRFGRGGSNSGQFIAKDLRSDFGDTFTLEACGNGVVDPGEDCDVGASNGAPGTCCTAACEFAPPGTPCPDGNLCNGTETCNAVGGCVPGKPLVCDDGNRCTTDSCLPASGCQHTNVTNGTPCPDGNVCNGNETCVNGSCTSGSPLNCDDGNGCTTDTCDPVAGCGHQYTCPCNPAGPNTCTDNNVCNGVEACGTDGHCHTVTPALNCDDGNPCTIDSCDSMQGCQHTPVQDGTSCSDGDACNGLETCQGGFCFTGAPPDCTVGNPCVTGSCDPASGCIVNPVPDGTSCSDGNACNGQETCSNGNCQPGTPLNCDDNNSCTADGCGAVAGCQHEYTCPCNPADQNNTCTDNNVCNGLEACGADGQCHTVTPAPNCDDVNPCTSDSCDSVQGCQHTPVQDGTSCSDGNVCNGNETCSGGACQPGTPLNCDDGNPCTQDSCDAFDGCLHVSNGPCGSCIGGCDDDNPCTVDSCDANTGQCVHMPLSTGSCNDGTVCTSGDACSNGSCAGTPINCDDQNPCTTDTCDPNLGCIHTPLAICPGLTLCTLTQGAYGASNGAANGGQGWITLNPGVLPASIGLPGTGQSVTVKTQAGLIAFMPTNGTPGQLDPANGNLVINTVSDVPTTESGDGAGTLAGQTLALTLNIKLSNSGAKPSGLRDQLLPPSPFCTTQGQFAFDQCILDNAKTVDDLRTLADQALAGIPFTDIENPADPCLTYSEIDTALDTVNKAFDGCASIESCP